MSYWGFKIPRIRLDDEPNGANRLIIEIKELERDHRRWHQYVLACEEAKERKEKAERTK